METAEMEVKLAHYFNYRQNLIVPNVWWSYFNHEVDLLVLSKAGYAREIEIKISKQDLKKDKQKLHNHTSSRIRQLYFAIPEEIYDDSTLEHIPGRAGLLIVEKGGYPKPFQLYNYHVRIIRKAKINRYAEKWTEKEIADIARLGAMRIWGLKKMLIQRRT